MLVFIVCQALIVLFRIIVMGGMESIESLWHNFQSAHAQMVHASLAATENESDDVCVDALMVLASSLEECGNVLCSHLIANKATALSGMLDAAAHEISPMLERAEKMWLLIEQTDIELKAALAAAPTLSFDDEESVDTATNNR